MIVTGVELATAVVVTLKFAVEEPEFTVTGDETCAEPLLLDTVTFVLLGALVLRVIVHEKPVGGVTLGGLQDNPVKFAVTGWLIVMLVPEPLIGTLPPRPSEPDPLTDTADVVFVVVDEI